MNTLHDMQAWELLRRFAQTPPHVDWSPLWQEAGALLAQVDQLREAHTMLAHLQEIRRGLLKALKAARRELSAWHGWRLQTSEDYRGSSGAQTCSNVLEEAAQAILAAEAGKVPPPPNARLIAAAPDLLKACQAIIALLDGSQPKDIPGALMVAQSAIAKATGGAA